MAVAFSLTRNIVDDLPSIAELEVVQTALTAHVARTGRLKGLQSPMLFNRGSTPADCANREPVRPVPTVESDLAVSPAAALAPSPDACSSGAADSLAALCTVKLSRDNQPVLADRLGRLRRFGLCGCVVNAFSTPMSPPVIRPAHGPAP